MYRSIQNSHIPPTPLPGNLNFPAVQFSCGQIPHPGAKILSNAQRQGTGSPSFECVSADIAFRGHTSWAVIRDCIGKIVQLSRKDFHK